MRDPGIQGSELMELSNPTLTTREKIGRRVAVKEVWCSLVKFHNPGRPWSHDDALRAPLTIKQIDAALRVGRQRLSGNLTERAIKAFEATVDQWRKQQNEH